VGAAIGSTLNRVSLERRAPSELGVAAAGVTGFVDAVGQFEMHGLLVLKRGKVVAEAEWAPYRLREPALMYSLSKGFTSAAVGLAVAEGLLNLDDRVLDHLPEYADRAVPELRDLRIRHVLTMSSGHDRDLLGGICDPGDLSTDLVELLVSTPPAHAPGSWFQYNQPATFTAAAVVQRRANVRLLDYLRTRLFEPFDAAEPLSWIADSRARDLGFSGLRTDIETVACLGQLLLEDGVWNGRRLLPTGWVADASRAHVDTVREPDPDWRLGYGFQIWRGQHGYRHDGGYGQFCLVFPSAEAVVAITSSTASMQALLDEVYCHLLPALTAGGQGADADVELGRRLSRLAIELPDLAEFSGTHDFGVTASPSAAWAPSRLIADESKLRLMFPDQSTAGALEHSVPCRADEWSEASLPTSSGPLRCRTRGGRRSDGTTYITLAVADAPHRLILAENGKTPGTLTVGWNTSPLHGLDPAVLICDLTNKPGSGAGGLP